MDDKERCTMDEWEQGLLLIALYVVCVGGGYLYEWIKKWRTRRKKAQAVVDQVNHEIATETMEKEVALSKTEEKSVSETKSEDNQPDTNETTEQ